MPATPFDHPFLAGLLGDSELDTHFTAEAELAAMIRFEVALAEAEAETGVVPADAARAIADRLAGFTADIGDLARGTARDGVVVPALVKEMRAAVGEVHGAHVHFGATSQDVVDTALALRLRPVLAILEDRLDAIVARLDAIARAQGSTEMMAHTRMQAAIPVTAARKIESWRAPLVRHKARFVAVREGCLVLQFAGAAGTLDKLGEAGPAVRKRLAALLDLAEPDHARHSERDGQAVLAGWLSLVTGSLGKLGQDIALMAQNEVGEVELSGGGGSSAMPHKQNPVRAETLVALARFNATQIAGMHHALVHEQERSGAAWALEWMILPQMVVATGAALRIGGELLEAVERIGAAE